MEKSEELPDCVSPNYVSRESASSIVHIRKFLSLFIGIMLVVVGLGVAVFATVDELVTLVPFEMEQTLSSPYAASLPRNASMDAYLQGLSNKLLALEALPAGMQVSVHYVDSNEVNAFSTVGGHIFIYRGMLEKLPHENALVMLLAHEIGHVKYRHPLKGLGKGVVASMMLSMLFGTAYGDTVDKVFHDAGLLTVLTFNEHQELIADEEGVRTYFRYYQHGYGIADLYRIVEDNSSHSGLSNPAMAERIENIKQHYVRKEQKIPPPVTHIPAHIKAQWASRLAAGERL